MLVFEVFTGIIWFLSGYRIRLGEDDYREGWVRGWAYGVFSFS